MTALQNLLTALHDTGRLVLHTILIPVIAGLKALDAGVQHLITELGKV